MQACRQRGCAPPPLPEAKRVCLMGSFVGLTVSMRRPEIRAAVHDCPDELKTSDRGWTVVNVLKALIQNCKMANAISNSTSVVLTDNDIPGAA